jgi:hypothetical protein
LITSRNSTSRNWVFSLILLAGLLIGFVWANYRFAETGHISPDFLKYYTSTRTFILVGVSPYSASISQEIQQEFYGRNALPDEDQFLVTYPFYANLLFTPFALISNFTWAQTLWQIVLELSLITIAILAQRLAKWRPGFWLLPFYFLFSLFWYHSFQPLLNGHIIIIVGLLFLAALVAIRNKQDITAGIILAMMTITPLVALPLIFFVILWSVFHRRLTLVGWIFGSWIILVVLGMLFIPDWVFQYGWNLLRIPEQVPGLSLGTAFELWWPGIGTQLRWIFTLFLVALLIFEWWATWGKDFDRFLWTACLTMTLSPWIGISVNPENLIILLLPLVIIFSITKERWGRTGDWIVLFTMVSLFLGVWALYYGKFLGNQMHPAIMLVPMPLFIIIGLYWVRWWVLRPTRRIADA